MTMRSIGYFGTEEQQKEWIPRLEKYQIIGCYAQTEIGHGSDVQGLQTTATYDKERDQFIIHTPSLSAAKFWPGSLGKVATHALVVAKLIIDGKNKGQHMFIVPLRNLTDFEFLPGVQCGNVGPKHGLHSKENGYAIFTNVRIPRKNMLMKNQEVDRNGKFIKRRTSKLFFLTLMKGRLYAAEFASDLLFKGLSFAFRYGCYRTQFKTLSNREQRKLADYQLFQYRLVPYVAHAFAYLFLHRKQTRDFNQFEKQGQISQDDLAGMHASLSAVKAFTTWKVAQGIKECRERCGGHGFLKSAGFSDIQGITVAAVAAQGQDSVMALQTARFIIKNMKLAFLGKEVHPDTYYVKQIKIFHQIRSEIERHEDVTLEIIKQALTAKVCFSIAAYMRETVKYQRLGKSEEQIQYDNVQSDMIRIARYHFHLYTFTAFVEELKRAAENKEIELSLLVHLRRLALISGIAMVKNGIEYLYFGGYFLKTERQIMDEVMKRQIMKVRPVVIGLLEATERGDNHLTSSIGDRHKDPYEEIMKQARAGQLIKKLKTEEFINQLKRPKL